ncbi:hypothetical protein MHYP_G00068780 [Metynnis hypsauchen]
MYLADHTLPASSPCPLHGHQIRDESLLLVPNERKERKHFQSWQDRQLWVRRRVRLSYKQPTLTHRWIYVKAATGEWWLGFPDGSSAGRLSAPSRQAEPETVEVCVSGGCKYCGHFGATLMLPTPQPVSDPCLACPSCEVDFLPPSTSTKSWDRPAASNLQNFSIPPQDRLAD